MPCSSRARKRSDRVRGLIPWSDRSSSQNRCEESARSRSTRRVHLPEMISAVRQTGHEGSNVIGNLHRLGSDLERPLHPRFGEYSVKASLTEAQYAGTNR